MHPQVKAYSCSERLCYQMRSRYVHSAIMSCMLLRVCVCVLGSLLIHLRIHQG
jgi:hypothetical protein